MLLCNLQTVWYTTLLSIWSSITACSYSRSLFKWFVGNTWQNRVHNSNVYYLLFRRSISASRCARARQETRYNINKLLSSSWRLCSTDERRCFSATTSVSSALHCCSSYKTNQIKTSYGMPVWQCTRQKTNTHCSQLQQLHWPQCSVVTDIL